jgi:hypothetical protein
MIATSSALTTLRPTATSKQSSFLCRFARAFFIGCAPLASAYGFLPLPDEALYREPHGR